MYVCLYVCLSESAFLDSTLVSYVCVSEMMRWAMDVCTVFRFHFPTDSYHVSAGEIFSSIQEESDSATMAPSGSKV
jgi:hypothetical protein